MTSKSFQQRVLDFLSSASTHGATLKQIALSLKIPKHDRTKLRKAVQQLESQNLLTSNHQGQYSLVQKPETVTGIFRGTRKGHGFVRINTKDDLKPPDIFVHKTRVLDAVTGDEVSVRLLKKRSSHTRFTSQGEIVRIIQRARELFIGSYFQKESDAFVQLDGNFFNDPIYLGKVSDPIPNDAKVVLRMLRFPSRNQDGKGKIVEILGPRDAPGVDTLATIREFNIPDTFSEECQREAERVAIEFDETDLQDRSDLTDLVTVTIDPKDAKDFDDALSLERLANGHWQLGVHIADVSHFAPPGSTLFRTATLRGTSVYLPDCVIPMLPERISNQLASLQQDKVRFTKSVLMELDKEGMPLHCEIVRAAIQVKQRLDYGQVTQLLEHAEPLPNPISKSIDDLLNNLRQLSVILKKRRLKRGALELHLPEIEIELDSEGHVTGAHYSSQDISHQIVEECMLLANESVAQFLEDHKLLFPRRIHPRPDPRKLDSFAEFARSLGLTIKQPQDRFALQKLLHHCQNLPEVYAVNYAFLRSLKQAIYSTQEDGHFALASDCYTHFTSPIRRLADLLVHQMLDGLIANKPTPVNPEELTGLCEQCTITERRAEKAERELIKKKLLAFLESRIGMELNAIITGVEEYGFFAQCSDFPVEGLVHIRTLKDDHYYYEEATHSLIARSRGHRFQLGRSVTVQVAKVDRDRMQLDFRVVNQPSK